MTPQRTHAKATRGTGTVCGADDAPVTHIAETRHLVTCPDCLALADEESTSNHATCGDPRIITMLRGVVHGRSFKIDNVTVDPTTAQAILTVYDAVNKTNRAKLAALRIDQMATVAWQVLTPKRS